MCEHRVVKCTERGVPSRDQTRNPTGDLPSFHVNLTDLLATVVPACAQNVRCPNRELNAKNGKQRLSMPRYATATTTDVVGMASIEETRLTCNSNERRFGF